MKKQNRAAWCMFKLARLILGPIVRWMFRNVRPFRHWLEKHEQAEAEQLEAQNAALQEALDRANAHPKAKVFTAVTGYMNQAAAELGGWDKTPVDFWDGRPDWAVDLP